jgi:hypothetical protein
MNVELGGLIGIGNVKPKGGTLDVNRGEASRNDVRIREIELKQGNLTAGDGQRGAKITRWRERPGLSGGGILRDRHRERHGGGGGEGDQRIQHQRKQGARAVNCIRQDHSVFHNFREMLQRIRCRAWRNFLSSFARSFPLIGAIC